MAQSTKEANSAFKLARLKSAFGAFRSSKLDIKFVENILQMEGDINYRVPNNDLAGCTAVLHIAISELQGPEVFQKLLRHGADFTIKDTQGKTALREILHDFTHFTRRAYSASWGFTEKWSDEVVHTILAAHLERSISENPGDEYGLTHFHIACMADHAAAVRMFLDNGVPVDLAINEDSPLFPGCTPLDVAAGCCALEVVKVLLEYFDDERAKDKAAMSVMHWLIECNRRVVDDFIVEKGSISPRKWLSKFQVNQQIIHLLYDSKSCSFTSDIGLSDLHIACAAGNIPAVKDLLDHGVQIDHQVNENSHLWPGYTALHFAAYFDCEAVHLLLSKGANIVKRSKNGSTPLDICVQRYGVKDIHSIISSQSEWSDITLRDGKTKLIGLLSSMRDIGLFRRFLDQLIDDVNTSVSKSSPLWPGYTPLHLAVLFTEQTSSNAKDDSTCKLELVEECLSRGADVTVQDLFGSTPLHLAFDNLKPDTIARLLQFHQSSANPIDGKNVSHLHIACASENEKSVEKLLQSGTDVNLPVLSEYKIVYPEKHFGYSGVRLIPVGSTPLHIAVATENCEMVKRLIDNGADVNATDVNGVSPIHSLLLEHWHARDIAKILLSANLREVVVSGARISHLHVASYFGNVDAVKRLLDLGADAEVRFGCQSALLDLCDRYNTRKGRVNISSWNYAGATAWHLAVWEGSREVAQLLSSRVPHLLTMTDVWRNGLSGEFGLDNIISSQSLVDNEALARRMKEDHGLTALHLACYEADLATVRKLIDDGMDVNARCNATPKGWRERGYTPLHMLVTGYPCSLFLFDESLGQLETKVLEITRVLLNAGADVSLCDETGSTALHLLILDNDFENTGGFHTDMLNLMLNGIKNFRVNPIPTSYSLRMSLFHVACLQRNTTIIRKFLEHGVDVNAVVDLFSRQNEGYSPLLLVVDDIFGPIDAPEIEAIDALLEHGADVNAQNLDGDTTLHTVARSMSDQVAILARLISAGADLSKLNNACETPFDVLLLSGMATPEGVQLFIDQGCPVNDFNVVDQQGCLSRPLFAHRRAQNRARIFETLFKSPRVTELDAMGRTAIHNIVSTAATKISRYGDVVDSENVSVDELCSLITRLCKKGCDIDCRDRLGRTALHVAASFKNNKAVVALLMNGADVNVTDSCSVVAFKYCFDPCERQLIKTFYTHLRKLEYLRLTVNETNTNLIARAILELDMTDVRMNHFYEEVNQVNSMKFEEDAVSFKLEDILSETGLVAVYPFKVTLKALVDKFIQNVDRYLAKYGTIVGLFKLQHRKAKERVNLIKSAADSLNQVVGFPFPELCRQRILRFLSNSDFQNLIYIANLSELSRIVPEDSLRLFPEVGFYRQNLFV